MQDVLAERFLAGIKLQLTAAERREIEKPLTHSAEAYEFYLRGRDLLFRYLLRTYDENDLEAAIKMIHEAIGKDPEFARAHASLGRCYVLHASGYGGPEYYVLAERSLKRALELDPTITNARLQMIYVDLYHGDKEKARFATEELLREHPEDPSVLFVAGMLYRLDGLYEKALETYDRLLVLNPKDTVLVAYNRARIYTHQGRFEEAVQELEKGREAEPEHPLIKTFLAVALFNQGQVDWAQALLQEVLIQNPHFDGVQPLVAWCLSARGEHEKARALITDRVKDVAAADRRHRLLARLLLRHGRTWWTRGSSGSRRPCASATRTTPSSSRAASSRPCGPTPASGPSWRTSRSDGTRVGLGYTSVCVSP